MASSATATLGGDVDRLLAHAVEVTTPAGGPYVSNAFSWSAGTSSPPTESVTGSDTAGNTATTGLSFVNDSSPASGGSVDATGLVGAGLRYSQSLTLHVAFAKGTDGGSGLAASGSQLLRATAALTSAGTSDGSCGTLRLVRADRSPTTRSRRSPTSYPGDNACYSYEYLVPDRVGNVATYASGDIKVETTTPGSLTPTAGRRHAGHRSASQYVSGSTVYYNPTRAGELHGRLAGQRHALWRRPGRLPDTRRLQRRWERDGAEHGHDVPDDLRLVGQRGERVAGARESVTATNNAERDRDERGRVLGRQGRDGAGERIGRRERPGGNRRSVLDLDDA